MSREMKLVEKPELGKLATFGPNRREPVYRWLYWKEGFARGLVFLLAEKFGLGRDSFVLDPFCGTGTTQLACRQLGIQSIGFDLSPVAIHAARVKLHDYSNDMEELKLEIKRLLAKRPKRNTTDFTGLPPPVKRAFSVYALEDIMHFRNRILQKEVKDEAARDFLTLGLVSASMEAARAGGGGGRRPGTKKTIPPLRIVLKRKLLKMYGDLKKRFEETTTDVKAVAEPGDARSLKLTDDSVDAVITSPPYLNKTEYARAYRIEEWLFLGVPLDSAPGYIAGTDRDDYFGDMGKVLGEFHRVCKPGAKLAVLIGNACYPDGVVECDFKIAELAESAGFTTKTGWVLNKRWCTKHRTIKIGVARETLLFLEK